MPLECIICQSTKSIVFGCCCSLYCHTSVSISVEFPDHRGITLTQLIQQTMKFRPVPASAGRSLFE